MPLGLRPISDGPIASLPSSAVTHSTSGSLVGQGSSVVGSASRTRVHPTSGTLTGQGSVITGSAARSGAAVTHATSGSLVGQGSIIVGEASVQNYTQPFSIGQGDDYPGWDRKAWKKKKTQEEALERTIEEAYKKIMGIEPTQTFVVKAKKEIKEQVQETRREFEDYSEVISWLQTQQILVDKYIREIALQREMDDEESILLLM